ncbi:hypothetical protein [Acidithrix ferrooxidans]|uniref:Uncharacterized protein n=1 Tax=Acidithrix ferrooxidans TaxID=1280514 RepID=A0A0D8HHJ9_9ACTN|nr:hypothetical protein [Acidithrix ferrooxidans]KJF16551.1 hypothetical protein AXFE_26140 [Acidithrix ferrooxidans]
MHFRPKLTLAASAAITFPAFSSYSAGFISLNDLLGRALISIAVSFVGVTLLSYVLAIFTAQSLESIELLDAKEKENKGDNVVPAKLALEEINQQTSQPPPAIG